MNQFTKVQIFPISHPDLFNFSDYILHKKQNSARAYSSYWYYYWFCSIDNGKNTLKCLKMSLYFICFFICDLFNSIY